MRTLKESILSKKEVSIVKNINLTRLIGFYTELFEYMKNYDLTYYDSLDLHPNKEYIYKTKIHGEPNYTSSKVEDMCNSINKIIKKHKFKFKKETTSNKYKLKSIEVEFYKSLDTYRFILETTDEYKNQEIQIYVYNYNDCAEVYWHVTIPDDFKDLLKII